MPSTAAPRRRLGLLVSFIALGVLTALAIGTSAQAYWAGAGTGSGAGSTGSLGPASNVVATATVNSGTVPITWTAATLSTGQLATGYFVERIRVSDSTTVPACGTSLIAPAPTTSCSDLLVPDGTYRYRVTALVGSWTSNAALSNSVMVLLNSTLPAIAVSSVSPTPNGNGYNNSTPVTVNLTATPGSAGTPISFIAYTVGAGSPVVVIGATAAVPVAGNGAHTVTFYATDALARVSPTSSNVVRIDTIAPTAPSAPVMTAATDTGTSSTDGITKIATPVFSGTAEVGVTVTIYNGATAIGSATATGGVYTIASSVLTEGAKTITAKATDLAGNVSATSTGTSITIDLTAPAAPGTPALTAASDTGRKNNDKITNLTTPTLTGSAVSGVIVTIYDGSTAVGSVTTASTTYSVTTSVLTAGTRVMTAKASDIAGNISAASASLTFTLDTTAPAAPTIPLLAAASDTGLSSSDRITNDTTITVSGNNEKKAIVTLYDGVTVVGTRTTTASSYSITSSALADGVHAIKATSTDIAGNVSVASGVLSVTIDTSAPVVPSAPTLIAASDTGVSATDRITKVTTPTLTGTAEAGVSISLRDGGVATGAIVTANGGNYSATTATLSPGAHTLTAVATDVAGNVGGASASTIVTIDTAAPTVTINQAAGQADPTTITPITFSIVFSETAAWLVPAPITLSGTAAASTAVVTGSGTTYSAAVSGMTRTGTVVVDIAASAAQDVAGNLSTASTSTDKTVTFTDATAPVVVISSFTPGGSQTSVSTGTAGFGPGDAATVTLVLCKVNVYPCTAGNTLATLTATVTPVTGAWTVTSAALGTQPTIYARATQTDLTGNTGTSAILGPIAV